MIPDPICSFPALPPLPGPPWRNGNLREWRHRRNVRCGAKNSRIHPKQPGGMPRRRRVL